MEKVDGMKKVLHVLLLTNDVHGPDGAMLQQLFASKNLHVTVTMAELAQALEEEFKVYPMELTINGQLIAKVEVVK